MFGFGVQQSSRASPQSDSPTKMLPQDVPSNQRRSSKNYSMLQRCLAPTIEEATDGNNEPISTRRSTSDLLELAEPRSSIGASRIGVFRRASLPEEITVVQDDRTEREVCRTHPSLCRRLQTRVAHGTPRTRRCTVRV